MDLNEAERLANRLILMHLGGSWFFKWNRRQTCFGYCKPESKIISLSKPLTLLVDEDHVRDTILHEICHAIVPEDGHGNRWKELARKLGADPSPTSNPVLNGSLNYTWFLVHEDKIIRKFLRKPSQKQFAEVGNLFLRSDPESRSQLYYISKEDWEEKNGRRSVQSDC